MFYSRSSLSRKGPLGAIWIAAYFLKRLKKAQVVDTHIPSSVDEILQNELDATVAYRVLAYLLLGLVRIYSKKVEYLFDDCQDVMFKIKDFFVGERSNSQLETRCLPNYTITVPDRFELEAFDLGILEDVSRDNVVPLEEITLKDCASKAVGIGLYSLGKYHCEELAAMHDIGSTDYLPTEDIFPSHLMENDMYVSTSHDFSKLEASLEKLLGYSFLQEESVKLDSFCGIDGEAANPSKPFGEDHRTDGEHIKVPAISEAENEVQGKASTEMLKDDTFHGVGEETLDLVNLHGEDHQSDGEQMKVPSLAQLENEMCQDINEDNNLSNLDNELQGKASTEKLQDDRFYRVKEETLDLITLDSEHQSDGEQMKVPAISETENAVHGKASTKMLKDDRFHGVGEETLEIVNLHGDHQSNGQQMKVLSLEQLEKEMCNDINEDNNLSYLENEMQGKAGTEMLQDDRFHGVGEEYQSDGEQMKVPSLRQLENEILQDINEDNNLSNLEASTEKLLDHRFPQEVCMDVGIFGRSQEEPPELTKKPAEEHTDEEQVKSMEILLSGNDKCLLGTGEDPVSVTLDRTPQPKFPLASGHTSPGFMVVHTPTTKEPAQVLGKRKCCFDDVTVFPNDVIRRCIEDASDLVSRRRKVPHTALAAWKAFWIPNLSHGFFKPLLPCISSELNSLFCQERLKIPETSETVGPLEPESATVHRLVKQVAIAPKTPTEGSFKQMATNPEITTGKSSEQMGIAPETPMGKSLEQIGVAPEASGGGSSEKISIAPETPTGRSSEQIGVAPETPSGKSSEQIGVASEAPNGRSSEQISIAPETPPGRSSKQRSIAPETPSGRSFEQMAIMPETPTDRCLEQMAIAPETPTDRSSEQMAIAPETPIFDSMTPGPVEAPESHKTSHSEEVIPTHSFKIVEKEPTKSKDQEFDLTLMNEETNSFEADNQEPNGLSERTRIVARYLHRRFLYQKNRRENEAVNLLQLLEGKLKKESARLFYEMLVLKTKGFVDVRQDEAYGDILIQKVLKWDQIYGAFCL